MASHTTNNNNCMSTEEIIRLIWSKDHERKEVNNKFQKCNCYDTLILYLSLENINDNLTLMKLKNFKQSTLDIIKKQIEQNTPLDILKFLQFININWRSQTEKIKVLTKLQNIGIKTFPELLDNVESVNDLLTKQNEKTFGEATIQSIKTF